MYKVLLVDDEVLIREAIAENIDWNGLGFELAGICENGKEAIAFIEEQPLDLVLTDICMPYVDGLELAEYIYENHEEVKVIIISGYDNFEYAKGAIKYQVMEYILKPVTAYELSDTLGSVRERLDNERKESRQMDRIKKAYKESMPILRDRFLNQMIHGKERCESIEDALKSYDIVLKGESYAASQISSSSSFEFVKHNEETVDELTAFAVFNVTEEMLKEQDFCVVFQDEANVTTILTADESEYYLEKRMNILLGGIQNYLMQHLQIHTMAVVGKSVGDLKDIVRSYENILSAREYQFLFEEDSIMYGKEFYNRKEGGLVDTVRWSERIIASIKQNNEDQLLRDIKEFFLAMKKAYTAKNRMVAYVQGVILTVLEVVEEIPQEGKGVLKKEQELLEFLGGNTKIEDMEHAVREFCLSAARAIAAGRENMGQVQAVKAMDYIEKNYQDPNISLNSVCRYLAMSTSYFSVVFKGQTGITFIEALTRKRMEKAKELLETTDMKTYQIAEEVGYSDPHYFGSTFKKYVGETPKEYAKKRR